MRRHCRYRMPQTAERRRALPATSTTKPKMRRHCLYRMPQSQKGEEHCLQRVPQSQKGEGIACSEYHKAKNEKALPATSITNTRNEKSLPAPNATTARKEVFPLTQRGVQCEKRSPPHRGKTKRERHQNRSLSNLGCDVGLEPTTPRTTIWCSTN